MINNENLSRIKEYIKGLPDKPGIYMMKDNEDNIIYVGKAINLKKRVSQYFNKTVKTVRIIKMVSQVFNIDYIVTESELEALVLECNYIKEKRPKYNVCLKDDKTYPYIRINTDDKYPGVYITRQKKNDKAKYFGPYTDVRSLRSTLAILKEIFPIKRCRINLSKTKLAAPCLYYHIGRCIGPCINEDAVAEYKKMIDQVVMFLNGKTSEVKEYLKLEIEKCIENLEFEKAAKYKDSLIAIDKINEKQKVSNINEVSSDIFGYILKDNILHMQVFKIRDGIVSKHDNLEAENVYEENISEQLLDILAQYYISNNKEIPKKIMFRYLNDNKIEKNELDIFSQYISKLKGEVVEIKTPKIGDKLKLIQMIENNIDINLKEKEENKLEKLTELIGLNANISKLEAYDISNLGNEYIVGAMITYENGKLNKNMYRKFKIKSTLTQDDPACMAEIVSRRLDHIEDWGEPELILIDGGITQVRAVKKVLEEKGIDVSVIGMIKNNKHKTMGILDINEKKVDLTTNNETKKILNFVTFVQDEAHRFVIRYHRSLRDKIYEKKK